MTSNNFVKCVRGVRRHQALLAAIVLMIAIASPLSVNSIRSAPSSTPTEPVINSVWTDSPPRIDGNFTAGEWLSIAQIVFEVPPYPRTYVNASVYFANDATNLYILVDAIGDRTDDAYDETLVAFGFPLNNWIAFWGSDGTMCRGPSENCKVPKGVVGAIGFDVSPNSAEKHKIFETSIPLQFVEAAPGESVDFCSPKVGPRKSSIAYDYSTKRDNVWPEGLVTSIKVTWGILVLAAKPVPEFRNSIATVMATFMLVCLTFVAVRRRGILTKVFQGYSEESCVRTMSTTHTILHVGRRIP